LACSIPDLELDGARGEVALLSQESRTDSWLLVLLKVVVDKAQDEGRLLII